MRGTWHLLLNENGDIVKGQIVQFWYPVQILPAASSSSFAHLFAIGQTCDDGTNPHDGRVLDLVAVDTLLATVKAYILISSQTAGLVCVSACETDKTRSFGDKIGRRGGFVGVYRSE
jgi:hypothetical protein